MYLVVSIVVSALFLSIFSYHTSPFSSAVGKDAAFFELVGKGMFDGLLPYRDFYDMKGPYLFFIEALSQVICQGRVGVFIIQIISLASTLCIFMYGVFTLSGDNKKRAVIVSVAGVLTALLVMSATLQGGNKTEELSLPFITACILWDIRFLLSCQEDSNPDTSLLHLTAQGVFTTIVLLIRPTNAAAQLALFLVLAVVIIKRNGIRSFFFDFLRLLLGVLLALIPPIVFALSQGILTDMLDCIIGLGFSYTNGPSMLKKLLTLLKSWLLPPCVVLILPLAATAFARGRDTIMWMASLMLSFATGLSFLVGNLYLHYVTLVVPVCFFSYLIIASTNRQIRPWFVIVCVLVGIVLLPGSYLAARTAADAIEYRFTVANEDPDAPAVKDIVNRIPDDEKNSVFCLGDHKWSRWYLMGDLYPYCRYHDWQANYLAISAQARDGLQTVFEKDPPRWLVCSSKQSKQTQLLLDEYLDKYEEYYSNDSFVLYRLSK